MFYIFLVLLAVSNLVQSLNSTRYTVKIDFPIYAEENFVIHFHAVNKQILPYTVIMLTAKVDGKMVEEHVFNPGFQLCLPKRIYGEYFNVKNYTVKPYLVEVIVKFHEIANKAQFELFFFESSSRDQRINVMNNSNKFPEYKLGSFMISLWLHWKLELIQKTLDHREDGLIANSSGILICKASGGLPFSRVQFIGIQSLNGVTIETGDNKNEIQLQFNSKIEHHMKQIGCQAGKDVLRDTIKIFHHPTSVKFVPAIDGYVKNGTSITCYPGNGYPSSSIKWAWVSGPKNSELYFKISKNKSILKINKNAPLNSKWIFECNATNTIPNSLNKGTSELVSFIVGVKPIPYILICVIVISLILIIILLIILVQFYRNWKLVKKSDQPIIFQNTVEKNSIDKKLLHNNYYPIDEV